MTTELEGACRENVVSVWLFGIARNTVADWWRRRTPDVSELTDAAAAVPSAEDAFLKDEVLVALRFGAGLRAREAGDPSASDVRPISSTSRSTPSAVSA